MKVLINTPHLKLPGGVSNHYRGLSQFWSQEIYYNEIGKRHGVPGVLIIFYDYVNFLILCIFGKYDLIVLNPSLGSRALKRDALFLKISKIFKKKVLVFIHGWDVKESVKFDKNPKSFIALFSSADGFIVLASSFKEKMISWGIKSPIWISTTKVDDRLLKNFNFESKVKKPVNQILFLARIEISKGIIIALDAFQKVTEKYPNAVLIVAGQGDALIQAKQFQKVKAIPNVTFLGNISGEKLIDVFTKSDIYLLPTSHGEGMPTSVLESMAFGLPTISRPIGGLVDFFEEDQMGWLIKSQEPNLYSEKLIQLLSNPSLCRRIGGYNHNYAKNKFLASIVAKDLENIFNNVK